MPLWAGGGGGLHRAVITFFSGFSPMGAKSEKHSSDRAPPGGGLQRTLSRGGAGGLHGARCRLKSVRCYLLITGIRQQRHPP